MPEVGRPPGLGIGHDRTDILLQRLVVDALERSGIVEVLAEGVRHVGVLPKDVELEGIGPPGTLSEHVVARPSVVARVLTSRGSWCHHLFRLFVSYCSETLGARVLTAGVHLARNGALGLGHVVGIANAGIESDRLVL